MAVAKRKTLPMTDDKEDANCRPSLERHKHVVSMNTPSTDMRGKEGLASYCMLKKHACRSLSALTREAAGILSTREDSVASLPSRLCRRVPLATAQDCWQLELPALAHHGPLTA